MKKLKISLKENSKFWSFQFYDSSESAFYMKDYPDFKDNIEYTKRVTLKKDEFLEIEWLGSEWVYHEDGKNDRYDKIRIVKFTPIFDSNQWDACVDSTVGWLPEGFLNWGGGNQKSIKILQVEESTYRKEKLFVGTLDKEVDESEIGDVLN